jgi:hypothetical protein
MAIALFVEVLFDFVWREIGVVYFDFVDHSLKITAGLPEHVGITPALAK